MGVRDVVTDVMYRTLTQLGRTIALDVCQWEVHHLERVPRHGRVIVASNHVSFIDPVLISSLVDRPLRFMASEDVFRVPIIQPFLKLSGALPVRRGRRNVQVARCALRLLQEGGALGIFPEGTRGRRGDFCVPLPFRAGVGWLAIRSRAPVVPVAIEGYAPLWTGSRWTRPTRMRIRCGEPIRFCERDFPCAGRELRQRATEAIYDAIASLMHPSRRANELLVRA